MRRLRRCVGEHRAAAFRRAVGSVVVTLAAFAVSGSGIVLVKAQRAKNFDAFSVDELRRVRLGIVIDYPFIVGYVTLICGSFSLFRDRNENNNRCNVLNAAGVMSAITAGVADAVEDILLWQALDARNPPDVLAVMRRVGIVKWGLLAAAITNLVVLVVHRCTANAASEMSETPASTTK